MSVWGLSKFGSPVNHRAMPVTTTMSVLPSHLRFSPQDLQRKGYSSLQVHDHDSWIDENDDEDYKEINGKMRGEQGKRYCDLICCNFGFSGITGLDPELILKKNNVLLLLVVYVFCPSLSSASFCGEFPNLSHLLSLRRWFNLEVWLFLTYFVLWKILHS